MKITTLALLSASFVLGLSTAPFSPAAENVRSDYISFDAPGADPVNGGTFAAGMNNLGAIVGDFADAGGAVHGFLRSPVGRFTIIDVPGATAAGGTNPASINDLGEITGNYVDATGTHGFVRTADGRLTTFDVVGAAAFTNPIAINLEGEVVGAYEDANALFVAFLRRPDGSIETFPGPGACHDAKSSGCFGTAAFSINLFGVVVGTFEATKPNHVSRGFVRGRDGTLTAFTAPGAGTGPSQGTGCFGCGVSINAAGAIAGNYIDSKNVSHGYLRSAEGQFVSFDDPAAGTGQGQGTGCLSNCPIALNDFGAIAGVYTDSRGNLNGYLRAANGKFTTIDPPNALQTVTEAINDLGAITGYYLDSDNLLHSFVRRGTVTW